MTTVLHTFCLVVGGTILLYKARGLLRNPRDLANTAFCVYVGLSALSYLVLLPPVYVIIDRSTGIANSAGMMSGVCVLGLIAAQQVLLVHWTYPEEQARPKIRLRILLASLMLGGFLTAFFLFLPKQQRFHDFYVHYTHHLAQAPYLVIYIVACIAGQLDVVRHCWKYAKIANRVWLRRGMLTTTVGASVILAYCAIRVADITAGLLDVDLRYLEPVAWTFGDVGSALALIGWILPNVGPRLSSAGQWLRDYRAHNFLYPLWNALYQAVPSVALDPPSSRVSDLLRVRNIDFWLYRRVIEIQDARRALRPDVDNALDSIVMDRNGNAEPGLPMALATAQLRARQRRHGTAAHEERELAGEIRWLTDVAHEFVAYRRESG